MAQNQAPTRENPIDLFHSITHFDDTYGLIYDLRKDKFQYQLAHYIASLNMGASQKTDHPEFKVFTKIRVPQHRNAQIAPSGRTDNGNGTLTLTFTNPSVDYFRVKDTITDNLTGKNGYVVSYSAGSVTIEVTGGASAFVSADFAAGNYVTAGWNLAAVRRSTGTVPLYETNTTQTDYVTFIRDNYTYEPNTSVVQQFRGTFWASYTEQQQQAYDRLYMALYKLYIKSEVGSGTNSVEGSTASTQGMFEGMRTTGNPYPFATAPSLSMVEDMVMYTCNEASNWSKEVDINTGSNMRWYLGSFFRDFIQYGGSTNTFGGSDVVGTRITKATFANIPVKFVEWDFLSDKNEYPQPTTIAGLTGTIHNNTFWTCSWQPVSAVGEAGMIPVVRQTHFENEKEGSYANPYDNVLQGVTTGNANISTKVPGQEHEIGVIKGIVGRYDSFAFAEPTA